MDYKDRHSEDTLTLVDDDVEADCAPIESIHPIPDHLSKEYMFRHYFPGILRFRYFSYTWNKFPDVMKQEIFTFL
jgi:hypothetical protein